MSRPRAKVQGNISARLLTSNQAPGGSGRDTAGGENTVVPKRLSRGAKEAGKLQHRAMAARKAMKGATGAIYRKNNANVVDVCSGAVDPDTEVS